MLFFIFYYYYSRKFFFVRHKLTERDVMLRRISRTMSESICGIFFFSNETPSIIPGNTGVHDLVTVGRVIWVIDNIRTRLHVRAHTFTRADCTGSWD